MNQPNIIKFRAYIGDFKFCCTSEYLEIDKVANNLARQYTKKLFGRHGDIASMWEGRHSLTPQRYWNYEGYIGKFGKFDKFGIFLEGRCIDFNFTKVALELPETHIQKRLRLLHQQINLGYSIPELRHQALQERVLTRAEYFGVCPIPAKSVTLADVLE
jgi:hypothetical protein